jgi:hypothetical protein
VGGSLGKTALNDKTNPLPILNYLVELGKDYDYFFTIEEAWREEDLADSIVNHWVQRSSQKKTVKEELEQLQQAVPNLGYEIDSVNPKIVHIKDMRLTQQKDYGLEAVIKSIEFTGKVHDLVSEINHQGIPVSAPLITFNNETMDYDTVLQVKGVGLKVRDALSNFIQLEGRRSRILWTARTKLGQREVSYVRYP